MWIYPVFYILLLEPAPTNTQSIIKTEEILSKNPDNNKNYKMEKVLDSSIINR